MAKWKPTQVERFMKGERAIAGTRAFFTGVVGASVMMAFTDAFSMMGATAFSYEVYLGSLIRGTPYGTHNWTIGVLANWLMGGLFGLFYAYLFEFELHRSGPRVGVLLGLGHAAVAAFFVFPFFNAIHEQMGVPLYSSFGFLGSGINAVTPLIILGGHALFGLTVGFLYGPVGVDRVRARLLEPGGTVHSSDKIEVMGDPDVLGNPDAMSEEDDPEDRRTVSW